MSATKPKIFVIYYSTYGHVHTLAQAVTKGLLKSDAVDVELYQIAETLADDVLDKMHAAPKSNLPIITPEKLAEADGFLLGFPTRFGVAPAQVKAFFDSTGKLWSSGALVGKPAGIFFSTGSQHGGQESTAYSFLPHFVHHGIIYVPLGYASPLMFDNSSVIGGSAWGAGTIAGPDGGLQPKAQELEIAETQGANFAKVVVKLAAPAPGAGVGTDAADAGQQEKALAQDAAPAADVAAPAADVAAPVAVAAGAAGASVAAGAGAGAGVPANEAPAKDTIATDSAVDALASEDPNAGAAAAFIADETAATAPAPIAKDPVLADVSPPASIAEEAVSATADDATNAVAPAPIVKDAVATNVATPVAVTDAANGAGAGAGATAGAPGAAVPAAPAAPIAGAATPSADAVSAATTTASVPQKVSRLKSFMTKIKQAFS
ncbi:hypothetical protein LPJ66_000939 [Kickxella alabastrina]|uniref:Uncharacterized protein n=1 Tax=Kickxella alabastrina TaxID=61397 RepID=A0ACC1IUU0_9FUNG|nr:hypothetical protein LPJ66_000939 [Kickxella alabastrina]